jgi:hypothetical protein
MSNSENNMEVIFFTLLPDDYHGWPMVDDFSNTPLDAPDEEDVYSAWSDAGYNAYDFGDGDDQDADEEENADRKTSTFQEYGNSEMYYATYMAITNNGEEFKRVVHGIIEDLSYDGEGKFSGVEPEDICEKIKDKFPGIIILPLRK